MLPAAASGGSAARLVFPCDSGTATVEVRPAGEGVSMSETLRGVAHTTWFFTGAEVSPYLGPDHDPEPTTKVARHGELTVSATNLQQTGSHIIDASGHGWPQLGRAELWDTANTAECGATLYLTATKVLAYAGTFIATVQRDKGTIRAGSGGLPTGGLWKVTATVESPSGLSRRSTTVRATKQSAYQNQPTFGTTLTQVPHLDDFTALTLTATSADGGASRTMTITRTP